MVEAFEHEPSADEEHEGKAVSAMASAPRRRCWAELEVALRPPSFRVSCKSGARGMERGDEPEEEGDENDHGGSEEENAEVHANANGLQRFSGQRIPRLKFPTLRGLFRGCRRERERRGFPSHLADDPAAGWRQSEAQRDFPGAGGATHEEEIGDV